jgi:hypothetical protein
MEEHRQWHQRARTIARVYIQKYEVREPPTPLDQIIVTEGITIAPMHWGRESQLDGLLVRNKRVIAINCDKPLRRQRFSLAHELGHYVLNHDYLKQLGSEIDIDHPPETAHISHRPLEAEADEFANELLVPGEILKQFRETSASKQGDTNEAFHRPFANLGKYRRRQHIRNEKELSDLFEGLCCIILNVTDSFPLEDVDHPIRMVSGMPNCVMRLSTEHFTHASVRCVSRPRAQSRPPNKLLNRNIVFSAML